MQDREHALRSKDPEEVEQEFYPDGVPAALADVPPSSTILSSTSSATTFGGSGWETVLLPFNSFVRTNHGYVVEPQTSIMRNRVKSIGIGLTDRIEGPFDLRIHKIWATNGIGEEEAAEERRICGADALPIDEGVRTGWVEDGETASDSRDSQKGPEEKKKGLKGLRSEWD